MNRIVAVLPLVTLLLTGCASTSQSSSSGSSAALSGPAICSPAARKTSEDKDFQVLLSGLRNDPDPYRPWLNYRTGNVRKIETSLRNCSKSPYSQTDLVDHRKALADVNSKYKAWKQKQAEDNRDRSSGPKIDSADAINILASVVGGFAAGQASYPSTGSSSGSNSGSGSGAKCYPHEVVNRVHNWPDC